VVAGDVFECDDCGELAARVEIWFPSLYWPEVEALVRFDEERHTPQAARRSPRARFQ
jgi:hypothetical protein